MRGAWGRGRRVAAIVIVKKERISSGTSASSATAGEVLVYYFHDIRPMVALRHYMQRVSIQKKSKMETYPRGLNLPAGRQDYPQARRGSKLDGIADSMQSVRLESCRYYN